MGNRPKPTATRKLEGNPGKRPLNAREPKLPVCAPDCPAHLGPVARAEWDRMVGEYIAAGLLTRLDGTTLADYCELYAISVGLSAAINAPEFRPLVIETTVDGAGQEHEKARANPLIAAKLAVVREMRLHLVEFGGTPASRSKVAAAQPEKDSIEALLEAEPDKPMTKGTWH